MSSGIVDYDQKCADDLEHVLGVVLNLKRKDASISLAFKKEFIEDIYTLLAMSKDQLMDLKYNVKEGGKMVTKPLEMSQGNLRFQLNNFVAYKAQTGDPIIGDDWTSITRQEFTEFITDLVKNPVPDTIGSGKCCPPDTVNDDNHCPPFCHQYQ